jgi:hypothetical protein
METLTEEKADIIRDGLDALASISESCHAVSTKRRFETFAQDHSIPFFDREFFDRKEDFFFEDKRFQVVGEFRQHGYGAWHIGSRISDLKKQGREILIIDVCRNRRFLLAEVQDET